MALLADEPRPQSRDASDDDDSAHTPAAPGFVKEVASKFVQQMPKPPTEPEQAGSKFGSVKLNSFLLKDRKATAGNVAVKTSVADRYLKNLRARQRSDSSE